MQFATLTAMRHQIVTIGNNHVANKNINGRRQPIDGRHLQSLLK